MRELLSGSNNVLLSRCFSKSTFPAIEELLSINSDIAASVLLLDLDDDIGAATDAASKGKKYLDTLNFKSLEDDEVEAPRGPSRKRVQRRASFMLADTVTTKFKSQLSALMDTITTTEVSLWKYVKCDIFALIFSSGSICTMHQAQSK